MLTRKGGEFARFVVLALIGHSILFLGLAALGLRVNGAAGSVSTFDQNAIDALTERWTPEPDFAQRKNPALSRERASSALSRALGRLRFEAGIGEADQSALAEVFLQAASRIAAGSRLSDGDGNLAGLENEIVRQAIRENREMGRLDIVPLENSGELAVRRTPERFAAALDRFGGDSAVAAVPIDQRRSVLVPGGEGPKEVPAEYFFRPSPLRDMAAFGADLFPAFEELAGSSSAAEEAREPVSADSSAAGPAPGIVLISVRAPRERAGPDERPSLNIGGPEIEEALDRLMALDVEQQLDRYEREFLDRYGWASPGLAHLTREFIYGNLNGIFFVLDDLAAAYDMLEELFYKRPVIESFRRWAGRFPGTPTDSEIGFYFVAELDHELRAFRRLMAAGEAIEAVLGGRKQSPGTFQARAKAAVLDRIRNDIGLRLKRLRMSPDDLVDRYLRREQALLSGLSEQGGEIRNRALVRWGELLWREGDHEAASAKWKMVELNVPGYTRSFGRILSIILRFGTDGRARRDIEDLLAAEDAVGRAGRLERQLRFHVWARRSAPYDGP